MIGTSENKPAASCAWCGYAFSDTALFDSGGLTFCRGIGTAPTEIDDSRLDEFLL